MSIKLVKRDGELYVDTPQKVKVFFDDDVIVEGDYQILVICRNNPTQYYWR